MKYKLPSLLYSYNYFEPYIDSMTMRLHYTKHHQGYLNNINNILQSINYQFLSIEKLIISLDKTPSEYRKSIRNNAGGYFNHNLFWKGLNLNTTLSGLLKKMILEKWNSINNFKNEFIEQSVSLFGSGWIWLVIENNCLSIRLTHNQDNPLMGTSIVGFYGYPIICLDLWEHAYYLKYQNKRCEYVESFWNIINWDEASLRLQYYMNNYSNI
ncbi:superoxide dismutase [Buchnera aphidicola (Nipponaphis monzeni)]|uniref:Superoxide dismutase n=1 Tax=Buchnera aphidicola (Nipponaphis monzeni) TaxID=2495405 RepID=A0A455T9Z3_9GAMM|nr:Fe-Mn family superoxide dismutase [Buchnera aphidicola]BBI01168.1 superoxide dismutase [Buchnera aphidicola (Nipponaphis monzeni)]